MIGIRCALVDASTKDPFTGSGKSFNAGSTVSTGVVELKKGEYICLVEGYDAHNSKLPQTITCGAYSDKKVEVTPLTAAEAKDVEFVLPEFLQKYGRCSACREPLSTSNIQAMGGKYHAKCWACSTCKEPIQGSFFAVNGKPICSSCNTKNAAKCAGCNEPVVGAVTTAISKKWHPDCFKCSKCQQKIGGAFFASGGKPVCKKCN